MRQILSWIAWTLGAVILPLSPSLAQVYVDEQDGPFVLQLSAPGGDGYVEATVFDTENQLVARYGSKCATDGSVALTILNGQLLQAFVSSNKFSDLQADATLQRLGGLLERACPQMQSLSVFPSHLPPNSPAIILSRSENWGAGSAPSAGPTQPLILLSQMVNQIAVPEGIPCNEPSEVLIDTPTSGLASSRSSNSVRDYLRASEDGAKIHEILCPGTDEIRFFPAAKPSDVTCPSSADSCYFSATWNPNVSQAGRRTTPRSGSRDDLMQRLQEMAAIRASTEEWVVTMVGYAGEDTDDAPSILTFNDLIDRLAEQDFTLIRSDYTSYFRLFHNQFLFAYSERCHAQIANPITFDVTLVEETVFGDGSSTGPRQVAPTYQLTLDRKFEATYRQFATANRAWMTEQMLSYTLSSGQERGGGYGASAYVSKVMSDKSEVEAFIGEGCNADRVQSVYSSLADVL